MPFKTIRDLLDYIEQYPKIAAKIKDIHIGFEPADGNEKRKIETLIAQWEAQRK